MKLSVKERLNVTNICPAKGNILTQTIVRDILEKVKFSQEELEKIKMVEVGNSVKWDSDLARDTEVSFTEPELRVLRDEITNMDKNKEITQNLLGLCLKIKEDKHGLINAQASIV